VRAPPVGPRNRVNDAPTRAPARAAGHRSICGGRGLRAPSEQSRMPARIRRDPPALIGAVLALAARAVPRRPPSPPRWSRWLSRRLRAPEVGGETPRTENHHLHRGVPTRLLRLTEAHRASPRCRRSRKCLLRACGAPTPIPAHAVEAPRPERQSVSRSRSVAIDPNRCGCAARTDATPRPGPGSAGPSANLICRPGPG
jgi:hypothetical protein